MNQFLISSESCPGLRRLLGKFPRASSNYSPKEVRRRLTQHQLTDPRTAAVHAMAARTGLWSSLAADQVTAELGRAATRLPTIVYWYRQGVSAHEIGRRLSPFGGAWDAEHALAIAAALIAYMLNQGG